MKVLCAWCKKDLGEKSPLENKSISHAICSECEARMEAQTDAIEIEEAKKPVRSYGKSWSISIPLLALIAMFATGCQSLDRLIDGKETKRPQETK